MAFCAPPPHRSPQGSSRTFRALLRTRSRSGLASYRARALSTNEAADLLYTRSEFDASDQFDQFVDVKTASTSGHRVVDPQARGRGRDLSRRSASSVTPIGTRPRPASPSRARCTGAPTTTLPRGWALRSTTSVRSRARGPGLRRRSVPVPVLLRARPCVVRSSTSLRRTIRA